MESEAHKGSRAPRENKALKEKSALKGRKAIGDVPALRESRAPSALQVKKVKREQLDRRDLQEPPPRFW